MKVKIFANSIILFLFLNYTYAQNYIVQYKENMQNNNSFKFMQLTASDSISWYEEYTNLDKSSKPVIFVKNYSEKLLYYQIKFRREPFYIKDTLHSMIWTLGSEQKTISGYICNSARTFFRGRYYTAYYCPQIAIPEGPWKFGGLPGLIMQVSADDKFISISLVTVRKLKNIPKRSFNLEKFSFVTWPQYKIDYKNHWDKFIQLEKTNPENIKLNSHSSLKIENLESIYKELEEGDGLSY